MNECYEFIAAEEGDEDCPWPVTKMCAWLGVSRSGYYEWRTRLPSPAARRRSRLKTLIRGIFDRSRGTYGYRRVHAVLRRCGEQVGPELVRALMAQLGLVACQPRPFRTTTVPDRAGAAAVPDRERCPETHPDQLPHDHRPMAITTPLARPGYGGEPADRRAFGARTEPGNAPPSISSP